MIYAAQVSLDSDIADKESRFGWAEPDKQAFDAVNDILRPVGTHLYGRRMYEVMAAWETLHTLPDQPAYQPGLELSEREFARMWRAANKIVYSKSLKAVSSARTQIERAFDPELIRQMKARAESDITVAGPDLASQAIKAGLVDEYHLFVNPVVVGGGKRASR